VIGRDEIMVSFFLGGSRCRVRITTAAEKAKPINYQQLLLIIYDLYDKKHEKAAEAE